MCYKVAQCNSAHLAMTWHKRRPIHETQTWRPQREAERSRKWRQYGPQSQAFYRPQPEQRGETALRPVSDLRRHQKDLLCMYKFAHAPDCDEGAGQRTATQDVRKQMAHTLISNNMQRLLAVLWICSAYCALTPLVKKVLQGTIIMCRNAQRPQ